MAGPLNILVGSCSGRSIRLSIGLEVCQKERSFCKYRIYPGEPQNLSRGKKAGEADDYSCSGEWPLPRIDCENVSRGLKRNDAAYFHPAATKLFDRCSIMDATTDGHWALTGEKNLAIPPLRETSFRLKRKRRYLLFFPYPLRQFPQLAKLCAPCWKEFFRRPKTILQP